MTDAAPPDAPETDATDTAPRSTNERLRPVTVQTDATQSPWTLGRRIKIGVFAVFWTLFCRFLPKQLNAWRLFVLRCFGATIHGRPFVAPSCLIRMPWHLEIHDRACLAPGSEVYNLAKITIHERATVAQHVYLCAGSHDVTVEELTLVVGEVVVEADAFIFAKAFVSPGVTIGEGAVIGACSVVTKDMPPWTICAGNPCRPLKPRRFPRAPKSE